MGDFFLSEPDQTSEFQSISALEVQRHIHNLDRSYHPSPMAWEDQILYLILPDRFSDGHENFYFDNDGKLVDGGTTPMYRPSDEGTALKGKASAKSWHKAGSTFVGGTLKGITTKIGYLSRLGVTALWIAPFLKQVKDTYHGYGVQDFLDVDRRIGTRDDLAELVKTAHSHGIYVILDAVL